MAHELYAREDGTLGVKPPDSVWDFFDTPRTLPNLCLQSPYARKSHVLVSDTGNLFCFSCTVSFSEGTTGFGIGLYGDEEKGTSYQYHFSVPEHRFVFENRPAYRGRQSTITAFLAQSNLKHTRNIRFALFVMIPSPSFI